MNRSSVAVSIIVVGFHQHTLKLEALLKGDKPYHRKIFGNGFHSNGHILRISSADSNIRTTFSRVINRIAGKYFTIAFI